MGIHGGEIIHVAIDMLAGFRLGCAVSTPTLCWNKEHDTASLAQMVRGLYSGKKTSTITWVRAGSGLQEKAAIRANQALEQLGILRIHRDMKRGRQAPGHETNDYKIDWVRLEACITQKLNSKTALLGIAHDLAKTDIDDNWAGQVMVAGGCVRLI